MGRGDKINRTALDMEDDGLVSAIGPDEKDWGGGKGDKEFHFGLVHFETPLSLLRGNISRLLPMQNLH